MPNWCRNRVTVYGNEEEVSKVVDIFESKDTVFGKIIPSPDWKNIPNEDGELPEVVEHKNPKTGEVSFVTTQFPKSKKHDDRWYYWNDVQQADQDLLDNVARKLDQTIINHREKVIKAQSKRPKEEW